MGLLGDKAGQLHGWSLRLGYMKKGQELRCSLQTQLEGKKLWAQLS